MLRTSFYLFLLATLTSCGSNAQTNMASRYKATPTSETLLQRFNGQGNRLEVNDCELLYNGKSFFIGSTLEEISTIVGSEPDYTSEYLFGWSNANVMARKEENTSRVDAIYIYLAEQYDDTFAPFDQVLLLNGAPLERTMTFGELIKNSNYAFEDFLPDSRSFELRPDRCAGEPFIIEIGSQPIYENQGAGHLQVRGDFNPEKTGPIRSIRIYLK